MASHAKRSWRLRYFQRPEWLATCYTSSMDRRSQTEPALPSSDHGIRNLILVGFGLLCFVNMACFFPHVLMPGLDQEQYRAFNFSATLTGLVAALAYALMLARGASSLPVVLSGVGHGALAIGIALAGIGDPLLGTPYAMTVGVIMGIGLSFSMLYWFCMLFLLPDSQVMGVQGLQALGGELLLIGTVAIGGAVLHGLLLGAALASTACAVLFYRRATNAGWALPKPLGLSKALESAGGWSRISDAVASPFVGLAIVSFLYGAITAVVMGPEGSPLAATISMWGAPIGAVLFIAWSLASRRKDFGFAMKTFFFVLVFSVAVLPFDAVSLGMSAGYQICSLLLFSYLIITLRPQGYRFTGIFLVLGYLVMRAFFLIGMYLPPVFSVSSYQAFISSTSLILFLSYLLFAGILFFTSRERRRDRKETRRALEERDLLKEQEQNQEKLQAAAGNAAEVDRLYQEACESIAEAASLTKRETEVMALLAKGRDLGHISQELYLARNTVKGYIKKVYTKLDVHTKQELIDMVEETRRNGQS